MHTIMQSGGDTDWGYQLEYMLSINKSDTCPVSHVHNKVLVIIPQPCPHYINIRVNLYNPL